MEEALEYYLSSWLFPLGMYIRIDGLSAIYLSLTIVLGISIFIYSIAYIKKDKFRYYSLLILALFSIFVAFTLDDLLNFYVFLEITTIATYLLIIQSKTERAFRAGSKYIIITLIGAALIFLAIILAHYGIGSYKFSALERLSTLENRNLVRLIYILFIAGCFIKAGIIPLHTWLPDAHPAAPSPISALLSGITIKIGLYGIIRFLYSAGNFGHPTISRLLIGFAAVSMLGGVSLAFLQSDAKRLLAYSSISQMGYVLLGIGIGTELGLSGALYHSINHALFKGLLFLCAGSVIYSTGIRNLHDLGGLRRRMPVTAIICLIASLAISGVPPLNGFISKTLLARSTNEFFWLKVILILAAAGTFASFLKFYSFTFLGALPKKLTKVKEVPWLMLTPMLVLTILNVVLGAFPNLILSKVLFPVASKILGSPSAIKFDDWNLGSAFFPLFLGGLIYYLGIKSKLFFVEQSPFWQRIKSRSQKISIDKFYGWIAEVVERTCIIFQNIERCSLSAHLSFILIFFTGLIIILFRFR